MKFLGFYYYSSSGEVNFNYADKNFKLGNEGQSIEIYF